MFISSTFTDMQAERDWLRDHVIPELEERLRERRHHLEPIDLRWGVETVTIDEQQAKELLVLKVCLDEIQRSRPFLIGLVGDRYGWVPPEDRMRAAVDEEGFRTDVEGKSVTALEIEFGVLDSADQKRRSLFYFRDPLPYDQMPPETAALYSDTHNPASGADAAQRLQALKDRIRRDPSLASRVHQYRAQWDAQQQRVTGLEQWGRQVLEDLWRDLDEETREFIRQPLPSWQDQERWALEEFVENRGRGFIGRVEITEELSALAESPAQEVPAWGACVTGEPGAGKSALFAHLSRELEGRDDLLVLAHAAGISPRSTQVDAMLRRWIGELAQALGRADPLPETANAEEVERTFGELLRAASASRRVVLLIDALDQFEPTPRSRHLTWLPERWPDGARLIATTIPGSQSQALGHRDGVRLFPLPPLDQDEAREIAVAVCGRYHRQLNPDVLGELLKRERSDGQPSAGIPLWLELALEELQLLDADDFERAQRQYTGSGDERLRQMMWDLAARLPGDVEALYGEMLQRCEELYGANWSRGFAGLIAVSRHGWREADLKELLPCAAWLMAPDEPEEAWNDVRFAALRRGFRAHLVQRGARAQWDFFHAQMRLAVERKWLSDPELPTELHVLIADHLESLPESDPVRQAELMFHQIGTQDGLRAARYYAGVARGGDELAGATRAAAEYILAGLTEEGNPRLDWMLSLLDEPALTAQQRVDLCSRYHFELLAALENNTPLDTRLAVVGRTSEVLQQLFREDPQNAVWQRELSVSHERFGDVFREQGDLTAALAAYRACLEIRECLAAADPENAGRQHDLSVSHERIGNVLSDYADLTGALAAHQASLEICARLVAADPQNAVWQRGLSVNLNKLGNVLLAQGDPTAALAAYRANREIFERLAAADPQNAVWQHDLSVSHSRIGYVLSEQGDLTPALAAYRACLEIRERLAAADPQNAGRQHDLSESHDQIGVVLRAQGDLTGALVAYRASREIMERLVAADPQNAVRQHDLSVSHEGFGDVLSDQGDLTAALAAYRASLEIRERLAAADPGNAGWQRDLSVSHINLGDVLRAQGDLTPALAAHRASLEIRERLAEADPQNAGRQRDLAGSYENLLLVCNKQQDQVGLMENSQKCFAVLSDMKRRGMHLEPQFAQIYQDFARVFGGSRPASTNGPSCYAGSRPHADADPNRAAQANIEYQERLMQWKGLPLAKRLFTKRPERPTEI